MEGVYLILRVGGVMIREEYYSLQAGFIYMDYNCYEHTLSLTATFISQSPRKQTNYISVAPSESLPLHCNADNHITFYVNIDKGVMVNLHYTKNLVRFLMSTVFSF